MTQKLCIALLLLLVSISGFAQGKPDNGIELIFVKGGTFQMGKAHNYVSERIHKVTVSDFYIGKYEVTQKQWREVMGNNPSKFKGDNLPVEQVSWNDVQEFIKKLNDKKGTTIYRLPTEAEWEYAARGGAASRGFAYSGSNTLGDVAWYKKNSGMEPHNVGKKKPNELGLYDMSGNVSEWCADRFDDDYYKSSPRDNPQGSASGKYRVMRGCSWDNVDAFCRVTTRSTSDPDNRFDFLGFRLLRIN